MSLQRDFHANHGITDGKRLPAIEAMSSMRPIVPVLRIKTYTGGVIGISTALREDVLIESSKTSESEISSSSLRARQLEDFADRCQNQGEQAGRH